MLNEVRIVKMPLERYRGVVSEEFLTAALELGEALRKQLYGRVIWNINSTAAGGGVAEMLHRLVGYGRGMGMDSRWLVVSGDEEFFRITKRLHNALHGAEGDGSELGPAEHEHFEAVAAANFAELSERVGPRDVFILHDPQTAGLIPHLLEIGAAIIWRCHVGTEDVNDNGRLGWGFLKPYITKARVAVFSREEYVPDYFPVARVRVIPPNIDPFSPKNQELSEQNVHGIVTHAGFTRDGIDTTHRAYTLPDGSPGRVERRVSFVRVGDPPAFDSRLVTQVSRWDRLKDPVGVMRGFESYAEAGGPAVQDVHLVLAGPQCAAVSDDPEGLEVFDEVVDAWGKLHHDVRRRVHLASIPMDDVEENAAIVNALQRHSAVVVQKSIQEGFGLTVTEALWKGRPVLASAVGGIQDQIADRENGVMIQDPTSTSEFAEALAWLLTDADRAARIGVAARERVRERFLGLGSLMSWGEILSETV
ncbi:MAG: glycosyltransferase [Candidatus Binatia bacterium]